MINEEYEFFIAGRARNKESILKICDIFDKYNISYYCFLKNEDSWGYGNKNQTPEERQQEFESLGLKSDIVLNLFKQDLEGEKRSKNLLLVLPAGKAAHIESGIAYGMGKKCFAIGEYEATDTLYNIFEEIFCTEQELEEIQTMMLAFLSNVDEDHILNGEYLSGEEQRVKEAAKILSESPLYVEELPDFSLKDVENKIKKNIREHDIKYVFDPN